MQPVNLNSKKHVKTNFIVSLKSLFLKIILILLCYVLLVYSEISRQGIKNGINLCIGTLIPSLFPFMVLASFMVNSKIFENPESLSSKITEKLFYLPGYTYPAIILSFIGGYPVGAKIVKSLYENKKINDHQLNRMMCFCTCSGPAFTISLLGGTLLKNKIIGLIIFLIQISVGILIGIICAVKSRLSKEEFYILKNPDSAPKTNIQEAFVESTISACESMIQMCGIVIIFAMFIGIIKNLKTINLMPPEFMNFYMPKAELKALIISVLEVTFGCIQTIKSGASCSILSFAIGHGGMCTHFQIAAILKGTKFKYLKFCIFRWINAAASALIFYFILKFLEIPAPVFSTINEKQTIIESSSPPIGSAALIMLCLYFLITIKPNKNPKKY